MFTWITGNWVQRRARSTSGIGPKGGSIQRRRGAARDPKGKLPNHPVEKGHQIVFRRVIKRVKKKTKQPKKKKRRTHQSEKKLKMAKFVWNKHQKRQIEGRRQQEKARQGRPTEHVGYEGVCFEDDPCQAHTVLGGRKKRGGVQKGGTKKTLERREGVGQARGVEKNNRETLMKDPSGPIRKEGGAVTNRKNEGASGGRLRTSTNM